MDASLFTSLAVILPGNLSTDLVLIYAYETMLDIRGRRLAALIGAITLLEIACVSVRIVDPTNPARTLFATCSYVLIPFLLSRKPIASKVYIIATIIFLLFATEVLCVAPFALWGIEPFSNQTIFDNYALYLLEITLHTALFGALLYAAGLALDRLQNIALSRTYVVFLLFLICQICVLSFVMYLTFYLVKYTFSTSLLAIALIVSMSAADAALFVSIKGVQERNRQDRVRALREAELQAELEANEQVLRYLQGIASFRHDFGNQKEVIAELVRTGQFGRAADQVGQLKANLEDLR